MTQCTVRKILCVIVLCAISAAPAYAEKDKGKQADDKVATVNETEISRKTFDTELDQFQQRMAARGQMPDETQTKKMKEAVLQSLIDRELLYQQSQKKGIVIDAKNVQEKIDDIKKQYPKEEDFQAVMKKFDLTAEELSGQIQKGLAIQQLLDTEVVNKVTVPEEQVKAFYNSHPQYFEIPEQVNASHILVKLEETADETQKKAAHEKISDIQKKLKDGGNFSSLAKEFSEGPSGPRGGDLGFFGRGQMVKPFEDAAFALKVDEVSEIVETRFGYHLIKVTDKKPPGIKEYAEVKEKISEFLKREETQKQVKQYIDDLKATAKIETFI